MNSDSFLIHYDIDKYIHMCTHTSFHTNKTENKVPVFMILYHVGDLSM